MSDTWFTSDLHFWHSKVIEYCARPFTSVEEMNEKLIENWNAAVKNHDTIFCLGDFVFGGSTKIQEIMPRLKGRKRLIMGNHDWKYKANRWIDFGFEEAVMSVSYLRLSDCLSFSLSHFPFKNQGDHTKAERYTEFRLEDQGQWLLHGHVHQHWKIKGKQINVGVDQWEYKPVHVDELAAIVNKP